jgi:inhibitor of KinA
MCGDAAFTIELGREANVLLARTIAGLHSALTQCAPPGFIESIPGLTSLTVLFDPDQTSAPTLQQNIMRLLDTRASSTTRPRAWDIPVCYEGECAPDLFDVARACGMSPQQVIAGHTQRSYVVYLLGFSPGFPYLGDLDARLELPRLTAPRTRVPAGSVAIATRYSAIYPQSTAGGWHIIGRTPLTLFDPRACPPVLLAAGDTVRFQAVDASEYQRICAECATRRNPSAA